MPAPAGMTGYDGYPRDHPQRLWQLGNDRFRAKIEALAGRRAAPLPKGRPVQK